MSASSWATSQCASYLAQKEATLFELSGLYTYTQNRTLAYNQHLARLQHQIQNLNDTLSGEDLNDPFTAQLYADEVAERIQLQDRLTNFSRYFNGRVQTAQQRVPVLERRLSMLNTRLEDCN